MFQITNNILMIRPVNFRMNEQTKVNNYYQLSSEVILSETTNKNAQQEFDDYVVKLRSIGVNVIIVNDDGATDTPDAVFPNNWVSFHNNGRVGLYPMFAENRRLERRNDILNILESDGFIINDVIDYSSAEDEGFFLEGTGSIILDRINRKAYCALSPRADEDLFIEFCEDFEYTPVIFIANQTVDNSRKPIYHTNVMMSIAETFSVICLGSIDDKAERKNVITHLKNDGKEIIDITESQVAQFAGNMLQVIGKDDKRYLVMSQSAFESLSQNQVKAINKHCEIIHSPLGTIEKCGGGSARCMMAEIFLPKV